MEIIRHLLIASICAAAPLLAATSVPDEGLRQAFERAVYSFQYSGSESYQVENAAQRLNAGFDSREVRLSHPEGDIRFHLTGYGYDGRIMKPAPGSISANADRLEYQRGDLTEWYMNTSLGLEQGFTLAHRPGIPQRKGDRLMIGIAVAGGLRPVQVNETSVEFVGSHGTVLWYQGLRAWDGRGRNLATHLEVEGRELRLFIDDRKAQYPVTIDPTWTQQAELTATDAAVGSFGCSLSVSGDTAVIGAGETLVDSQPSTGAVYVFVRNGTTWDLQQELKAADGEISDGFGCSVALNGDTVVIGAPGRAVAKVPAPGVAYIFVRNSGVWTQQQELSASDGAASDFFGGSVAVNADTAVVGAWGKEVGTHLEQGAAYVFVRSGGVWTQQQEITENGAAGDLFGRSVAVGANTALIGAPGKSNPHVNQGAAYVFVRKAAVWTKQQELLASNGANHDYFGTAVALSGNTALIGAPNNVHPPNAGEGVAYVFVRSADQWAQQHELKAANGANGNGFGDSVALSGNTAWISAIDTLAHGKIQDIAYAFAHAAGVWSQQQEVKAAAASGFSSASPSPVAVDGDTAVIGANLDGAAYVFVH
jgi:FG-GAP repeat